MKWIAGLIAAMVLLIPIANAENSGAHANASNKTTLRLGKLSSFFNNFVLKARMFLTHSKEAKLELLKERNAEMKTKQQEWIQAKANALEQFKSGNLTAEQKQQIIDQIQTQHNDIVKEHLKLTNEIKDIQLSAKAKGDEKLENKAEEASEDLNETETSESDIEPLLHIESKSQGNLTADDAKEIVSKELHFTASNVSTVVKNNITFYVVTGTETKTAGAYELTKSFEVWVDASTGIIASANLNANIESNAALGVTVS